ncbi:MAG: hypothetical protein EOO23_00775 [Comamonadaceae bacterium]|nr:MAG: hypothetical protein EOO23_00775 [Comamonadaceae bacterium]
MTPPPATQLSSEASIWHEWEQLAQTTLVDAMRARGVGYKALSRELEKFGINESPSQLNRKVNRKRFSAAFLLASLKAIDASATGC